MRHRRRRIQYYSGDTARARLRDKPWLPFVLIAVIASLLALIIGAILGNFAEDSRLSALSPRDPVDFGGVEAPQEKYALLLDITGDELPHQGADAVALEALVEDLPEGNAVQFFVYDGAGKVYFDAALADKVDGLNVRVGISAMEMVYAAKNRDRYSIARFVSGAFREADAQKRGLEIAREMALLSELSEAGFHEIVIAGLPTDSERSVEVNRYMRQASETCDRAVMGVSVPAGTVAEEMSRFVAATETYSDSYFFDLTGIASSELGSYMEQNAYFLTAYNMRLMLNGGERDVLLAYASAYGLNNVVFVP